MFCFVLGCFGVPPKLVDQKLWFVNKTLLNIDYEVAVVQMEFDQDLYLSGETFVCGEAEKPCRDIDCIPCDWSSQQVPSDFFFLSIFFVCRSSLFVLSIFVFFVFVLCTFLVDFSFSFFLFPHHVSCFFYFSFPLFLLLFLIFLYFPLYSSKQKIANRMQ